MKKALSLILACAMIACAFVPAMADGMTAGTYEATAPGFGGDLRLSVTVDADKITAIDVLEHKETEGIGAAALPVLVEKALEGQTVTLDAVSGATVTSGAFVKALTDALTQAGADMNKFSAAQEKGELEQETLSCDIVVAGGGAAGLTAALTAVQAGKSVILVEKTGVVGGASAMAGSGTMATGSKWQKEDGYEDSQEQLVADMLKNGHNQNDVPTVELFASIVGSGFDWLVSEDGAAVPYQRPGTPTRTYSGEGRGAGVTRSLADSFIAQGGTLLLNTRAYELVVDNGTVVGLKAKGEKDYTIAAKAVILATGGYGANKDLVPDEYEVFVYAGHAGAEGDAIAMVAPLNAELIKMDLINTQPNSMILPSGLGQYCNPGVGRAYGLGAYMVNQDGKRFFNESGNAWDLMQAMKQNKAQYLIMDQVAFDGFNAGMTGSRIYTMEQVDQWIEDDYEGQPVMKKADTLEALAEKLGIPADAVLASAKAFNEVAANQGTDEFGRTLKTVQSEEGPFYALQLHIRYYASLGGLHINDQMQVLTTEGSPIPGLYAAGEVVGGLEGDVYMMATLFGWAVSSGHYAGSVAAAAIAE